jgi:hypothetical protein
LSGERREYRRYQWEAKWGKGGRDRLTGETVRDTGKGRDRGGEDGGRNTDGQRLKGRERGREHRWRMEESQKGR